MIRDELTCASVCMYIWGSMGKRTYRYRFMVFGPRTAVRFFSGQFSQARVIRGHGRLVAHWAFPSEGRGKVLFLGLTPKEGKGEISAVERGNRHGGGHPEGRVARVMCAMP